MASLIDNFLNDLSTVRDESAIWQLTANLAGNMGFSECQLTMAHSQGNELQLSKIVSSVSSGSIDIYKAQNLVKFDPFINMGCRSLTAMRLPTDVSGNDDLGFDDDVTGYFQDNVAAQGVTGGVGVPVRAFGGNEVGGWVFLSLEKNRVFEMLHQEYAAQLQLAAVLAYEHMDKLVSPIAADGVILTQRERECMQWLCVGLRVSMIAHKMSVGVSVVNMHIANAKHKLGAQTRDQAIALAITSGQVTL